MAKSGLSSKCPHNLGNPQNTPGVCSALGGFSFGASGVFSGRKPRAQIALSRPPLHSPPTVGGFQRGTSRGRPGWHGRPPPPPRAPPGLARLWRCGWPSWRPPREGPGARRGGSPEAGARARTSPPPGCAHRGSGLGSPRRGRLRAPCSAAAAPKPTHRGPFEAARAPFGRLPPFPARAGSPAPPATRARPGDRRSLVGRRRFRRLGG
mmetsp:Transcript_20981/g.47339  ORF Transcript_20981/g.47339 Transcript_20981/m.47339 type:complete len:208 (-) Transcript_20981:210-833(-)